MLVGLNRSLILILLCSRAEIMKREKIGYDLLNADLNSVTIKIKYPIRPNDFNTSVIEKYLNSVQTSKNINFDEIVKLSPNDAEVSILKNRSFQDMNEMFLFEYSDEPNSVFIEHVDCDIYIKYTGNFQINIEPLKLLDNDICNNVFDIITKIHDQDELFVSCIFPKNGIIDHIPVICNSKRMFEYCSNLLDINQVSDKTCR